MRLDQINFAILEPYMPKSNADEELSVIADIQTIFNDEGVSLQKRVDDMKKILELLQSGFDSAVLQDAINKYKDAFQEDIFIRETIPDIGSRVNNTWYFKTDKEIINTPVGVECTMANNDVTTTRLRNAIGLTPEDFIERVLPWCGLTRCILRNDGVVISRCGDANYNEDNCADNENVMVEIPMFYYKRVPVTTTTVGSNVGMTKWQDYISYNPVKDYKVHPLFIRKNGTVMPFVYISVYEITLYNTLLKKWLVASDYVSTSNPDAEFNTDLSEVVARSIPDKKMLKNATKSIRDMAIRHLSLSWYDMSSIAMDALWMLLEIQYENYNIPTGIGAINTSDDTITGLAKQYGNDFNYTPYRAMNLYGFENLYGGPTKQLSGFRASSVIAANTPVNIMYSDASNSEEAAYSLSTTNINSDCKYSSYLYKADYDFTFTPFALTASSTSPLRSYVGSGATTHTVTIHAFRFCTSFERDGSTSFTSRMMYLPGEERILS